MTSIDFKNLSFASASFKAGETILLKDGIYNNLNTKITSIGQPGARITIKPENPGKVILTGTSTLTITGSHITVCNLVFKDGGVSNRAVMISGNNNRITGFDMSYTATACEQMVRIDGIKCRVDHCIFRDWNNTGVWVCVWRPLMREDFAIIDHNIFQNRTTPGATNGLECVRIGTSTDSLTSSKTIFMYNKIVNCNGEIECVSNKSCDNIYYKNTIEACEGTLTLRHGNSCIVYQNKFDQKQKENSGGIRITGESHLVAGNLLKDVRGNGTTRVGISINNGIKATALNGYYQVKNTVIKNNTFLNCSDDYAIGVQVKSDCLLKPYIEISGTIAYHGSSAECFSSDTSCLGAADIKSDNNVFYGTKLGKVPTSTGIILKNPSEFLLTSVDESVFGVNEPVGPEWDKKSEDSEIKVDYLQFYTNLKNTIMNELNPVPVVVEQPAPVVVEQPAPVVVEQPAPVVVEQPAPVVVIPSVPVVVEQPVPVVVEQPVPVVVEQPVPVVVEQPAPVVVEQPAPVVVEQPLPVVVEQPIMTEQLTDIINKAKLEIIVQNLALQLEQLKQLLSN
jgi:hypothetical protein